MKALRRGSVLAVLWLVLMPLLRAEDASRQSSSTAYVYSAPSGTGTYFGEVLGIGGGGEGLLYKGLGIGGDLGYLFSRRDFRAGLGLASVNASYHLLSLSQSGKFVPFVTTGYTLGFRSGTAHFQNYGGGLTYWFQDKMGLRLELRNLDHPEYSGFLSFRVGVSFR